LHIIRQRIAKLSLAQASLVQVYSADLFLDICFNKNPEYEVLRINTNRIKAYCGPEQRTFQVFTCIDLFYCTLIIFSPQFIAAHCAHLRGETVIQITERAIPANYPYRAESAQAQAPSASGPGEKLWPKQQIRKIFSK